MPKLTGKIGSGMTERGVLGYDWSEPADVQAQVQAAIATFERSSFAKLFERLTQLAAAILDQAVLPSDPDRLYLVSPEEGWAVLEEGMDLGPELAEAHLSFGRVMELYRVPPDSPEGYAARLLLLRRTAREQLQAGSTDEAMASAFAAGELVNEAAMKEVFEPDVLTGESTREGGRKGHKQVYGTEAEKAAKRQAYREEFDQLRAQGHGIMEAYDLAAERFDVSSKTIQRAVEERKTTR